MVVQAAGVLPLLLLVVGPVLVLLLAAEVVVALLGVVVLVGLHLPLTVLRAHLLTLPALATPATAVKTTSWSNIFHLQMVTLDG